MHILLTGGTGLIGTALSGALTSRGYRITVLTRKRRASLGDGYRFVTQLSECTDKVDIVINLAGAGLADKRWTGRYKREIVRSRVDLTEELVAWMRAQASPPARLLSASAIGYYGASTDATFDETALPGEGFAAELCERWEAAAYSAEQAGIRVAAMRLGVVLAKEGGALGKMTQSFHFGLETWLGAGHQWLSWIHIQDVVNAIEFIVHNQSDTKTYNVVAPNPVQHRAFAHEVGQCFNTRIKLGVPDLAARLLAGEMAEELLLSGQRVLPCALIDHGFEFAYPRLSDALAALLRR
jgi:uncharacterized protein (TIGR01777 family)